MCQESKCLFRGREDFHWIFCFQKYHAGGYIPTTAQSCDVGLAQDKPNPELTHCQLLSLRAVVLQLSRRKDEILLPSKLITMSHFQLMRLKLRLGGIIVSCSTVWAAMKHIHGI